jgi:hypothetical protein
MNADAVLSEIVRLYNCHSAAQKLAKACKLTIGMNPFGSLENREAMEAAEAALKTWEEANK